MSNESSGHEEYGDEIDQLIARSLAEAVLHDATLSEKLDSIDEKTDAKIAELQAVWTELRPARPGETDELHQLVVRMELTEIATSLVLGVVQTDKTRFALHVRDRYDGDMARSLTELFDRQTPELPAVNSMSDVELRAMHQVEQRVELDRHDRFAAMQAARRMFEAELRMLCGEHDDLRKVVMAVTVGIMFAVMEQTPVEEAGDVVDVLTHDEAMLTRGDPAIGKELLDLKQAYYMLIQEIERFYATGGQDTGQ